MHAGSFRVVSLVIRVTSTELPYFPVLLFVVRFPNFQTDNQGREVARLTGGSGGGSAQQSLLTHTLTRARCEDSAVYTCTAQHGIGMSVSSSATLRVLCELHICIICIVHVIMVNIYKP